MDEKIAKLKRKKELLEEYKKGMMQKLFSQEIRFKDDDGNDFPDWEDFTLGHVGSTFSGLSGKSKEDFGEGYPFVQYMQVYEGSAIDFSGCGLVQIDVGERQTSLELGDVLLTTSSETPSEIGMSSVISFQPSERIYLNSFCFGYRFKKEMVPLFTSYLFRSPGFRKKIFPLAQGSTRFNLSKSNFLKLDIPSPTIDEQQKIGEFLTRIDVKITGVANQIDNAAEFKRGLLQKMFV